MTKDEMKAPGFDEIFAYLLQWCQGDEDSAVLLVAFISNAQALKNGAKAKPMPFSGTARFTAAHRKLKSLGIATFNHRSQQYEIKVGEILVDFVLWYAGSAGQTAQ